MATVPEPIDRQAAIVEAYAAALVDTWARAEAMAGFGVSVTQFRALAVIEQHGELTISALAAELGTLLSSASRLCDRLEASGLVSRSAGRDDRRAVTVALSRDGEAVFAQLRHRRRDEFARVLAEMPEATREALIEGLAGFHSAAGEPPAGAAGLPALALSEPASCRATRQRRITGRLAYGVRRR